MREIKFRGMKKVTKEWVYGYYIALEEGTSELVECIWQLGAKRAIPIDPRTNGQFTGLYDKNGKEIYEGDIIDIHGMYIVKFGEHGVPFIELEDYVETANGFYLKAEHDLKNVIPFGLDAPLNRIYARDCEIIGNIYENPELVKENEQC